MRDRVDEIYVRGRRMTAAELEYLSAVPLIFGRPSRPSWMARTLLALTLLLAAAQSFAATPTNTPTATATSTPTPTATLTLAQARTRVDNRLAAIFPTVQAKETTYQGTHGRFWQGLHDMDTPPDGGGDGVPIASRHPSYQVETWADIFPGMLQAAESALLFIDVYDGPSGQGYVAAVWVSYAGNTYSRAQNVGPESFRTYAWQQESGPYVVPQ